MSQDGDGTTANEPSRDRFQFTLLSLATLVATAALVFAGTHSFGAFGFVFGCLVSMIPLGHVVRRRNLQAGGFAGALVLVMLLLITWIKFGNLQAMDVWYVRDVQMRFQIVEAWLDGFRQQNQAYPEELLELIPSGEYASNELMSGADAEKMFDYQRREEGYDLVYLGDDRQPGGEYRDADVPLEHIALMMTSRMPFERFLFETPGSSSLTVVVIISMVVTAVVSRATAGKPAGEFSSYLGAVFFTIACMLVGAFMAGIHIAASQSGH